MKYLIVRIRAKISYMAFIKRMTISELFASAIMKCYYSLEREGFYPSIEEHQKEKNEQLMLSISKGKFKGFMKSIVLYNYERF